MSSLKAQELLHFLRRNASQFRQYLEGSSLGLGIHTTPQLLRAVSRRPDLADALRATGLGAGSDFKCDFDESPRDAGCQVRCTQRKCERAEQKCRALGHCISLDVNRDRTWATLKSLQVFMPAAPPTCEGYAFSADGSPTVPIAAPQAVVFDDLQASAGAPMGAPNEEWCYRDTSVKRSAAPAGVPHCSFESCFDLERCRAPRGASPTSPLSIFIDTPVPKTPEMARWPACMRKTMGGAMVGESKSACLVIPTLNINCEWDVCDPATHSMLRGMPSWNRSGHNHIIWDYIDGYRLKYRADEALYMKTAMRLSEYRAGFDLPVPLLPNGEAARVTPAELSAAASRRTVLASFKGICQPTSNRPRLQRLHDGKRLIMLCTGGTGSASGRGHAAAAQWDYKTLMLSSVFAVAPAGNGLHSFRLAEAIFFGAIPVIVDDEITLPFCSVLDWRRFSVRIRQSEIHRLPAILNAIPAAQIAAMQARLKEVKAKYFLFPFNTAMAVLHRRVQVALAQRRSR